MSVAAELRVSELVDAPNALVSAALPLDVFDDGPGGSRPRPPLTRGRPASSRRSAARPRCAPNVTAPAERCGV